MRLARLAVIATLVAVPAVPVVSAVPAVAGGGCHTPVTESSGTTVELSKLCMSPTVLRAAEGSTVTFVNRDPMEHNVAGNGFYTDFSQAGDTWQYRFAESGTYAYACTLHPGMTGAIVVGDGFGAGPVVDVGPYRPEPAAQPEPVTTPIASTTPASTGEPASVPLPLAVVLGVVIAASSAVIARRLRLQPAPPG